MNKLSFKSLLKSAPIELQQQFWKNWNAPQNITYHPEGNVAKHIITVTNRAIKQFPNNINLILAAFFHDLGKIDTLAYKNDKPTAHGHEDVSATLVKRYANWIEELGGNVDEIEYIVSNHMKIKSNVWDVMKQKKKDKITSNPAWQDLEKFGKIDKGGLTVEHFTPGEITNQTRMKVVDEEGNIHEDSYKQIKIKPFLEEWEKYNKLRTMNNTTSIFDEITFEDVSFDYTDYDAIYEGIDDDFAPQFDPTMAGKMIDDTTKLVDKDKVEQFLFAGKAIFTIRNNKTMNRFTFRVVKPKRITDDVYFVSVLTGSDNYSHYSFFGTIKNNKRTFKLSAKAKIDLDSLSVKAWMWFWKRLLSDQDFPPEIEIWHEGICGKCGHRLTVPESISIGLGPTCAKSAQLWQRSARLKETNDKIGIFEHLKSFQMFENKDNKYSKSIDFFENLNSKYLKYIGDSNRYEKGGFCKVLKIEYPFEYNTAIRDHVYDLAHNVSEAKTAANKDGLVKLQYRVHFKEYNPAKRYTDAKTKKSHETYDSIDEFLNDFEITDWKNSKKLNKIDKRIGLFEAKEEKMKQMEKDWQEIYKLNAKMISELKKVKKSEKTNDEDFKQLIKQRLEKFQPSNLKISSEGSSYIVKFNIDEKKFTFEFYKSSGKLIDKDDAKVNESTEYDSLFLGKTIAEVKDLIDSFDMDSTQYINNKTIVAMDHFNSYEDAVMAMNHQRYSVGKMQGYGPTGVTFGKNTIEKWRNLYQDAELLDAVIVYIEKEVYVIYFTFPDL